MTRAAHAGEAELTITTGASLLSASADTSRASSTFVNDTLVQITATDRHAVGGGFLLGFRAGYAIAKRTTVEAGLEVTPASSLRTTYSFTCPAGVPCPLTRPPLESKVGSYSYDASLVEELTGGAARPFLTAGVGGLSYDMSRADAPADRTATSLAFRAGAGVKLGGPRAGARLELDDQIVHDHFLSKKTEHDPRLRVGVFVRL